MRYSLHVGILHPDGQQHLQLPIFAGLRLILQAARAQLLLAYGSLDTRCDMIHTRF
jgi:hypothetical protein